MSNSVQRLNTAAVWAVSILFSIIGVGSVLLIAHNNGDSPESSSRCVNKPPVVTIPAPSVTVTSVTGNDFPPPTTYMSKDGQIEEGPPPTLAPTTWSEIGVDTCSALELEELKFGDRICVMTTRNGGYHYDLIFVDVIEAKPTFEGEVLPDYVDGSTHLIIADRVAEWSGEQEVLYDTFYSAHLGLTGSGFEDRTFRGTCEEVLNT